ncbi:MAG TPA: shikimate dehydrogenase [Acidimicrobiales bacterium]|nr:shikimate dehydrogenase [Acidimicrobiales bacterium]
MRGASGATRVAGVIGDPVRHSLSPAIHNAAFAETGLDWVFVAFPVPAGSVRVALDGVRALGIDGLSVTMPHKEAAAGAVDRLSPAARELGAVNTVVREGSELVGHNTDGDGFLDALRADEGFDAAGKRCAVLGAGGAARAVVRALSLAGAADIAIVNRTEANAARAAALGGSRARVAGAEEVGDADLVVNATPIGMPSLAVGSPLAPEQLCGGQLVVDLIYVPPVTPLMEAAKSAGAHGVSGLGMLVHQAAHAFRLWTGHDAPLPAMSAAAIATLVHVGR